MYTPWTRTKLQNLTKDFPDPLQDPLGFAQEFDLIVRTLVPGYSDLYQIVYLLVSESKAKEWIKEANWSLWSPWRTSTNMSLMTLSSVEILLKTYIEPFL